MTGQFKKISLEAFKRNLKIICVSDITEEFHIAASEGRSGLAEGGKGLEML